MKDLGRFNDPDFLAARPDIVSGMSKIGLPNRTEEQPTGRLDSMWLNSVTSRWSVYRKAAIEWIATRPILHGVDLLRLDEESLNEKFALPKPEIRTLLKIKRQEDTKSAYQYFALGQEIGKDVNQSAILSITRRELLQLYIATCARKYMQRQEQKGSFTRGTYSESRGYDEEDRLFDRIDRFMREKPEHGGPLRATGI